MEHNSQILYDSTFEKFVSYYESFLSDVLDPYRREKKGHFEDESLLPHLEAAFQKAVSLNNPLHLLKATEVNDYKYLQSIEEVSKYLLGHTSRQIDAYFLSEKEEAFVPDLTALSTEVSFNLREFAKQTLPPTIIKKAPRRPFYSQL